MSPVTLSICIATLNRADFIGTSLNSIINQATEEVEIVVVDGASTDCTPEIIERYQRIFPRLRYLRLDAKGGFDRDYCRAVELAQGEYCWLFADDDIMKPGAIQAVMAAIRHGYGLIVVNAEVRGADLSHVLVASRLAFHADCVYRPSDSEQLFVDTADYLSFIGGVVIKRQVWMIRDRVSYFGTMFVHIAVIFQQALSEDSLVIVEPLISIRYGNALWTGRSFEISLFKWPNLIWSFPDYRSEAKALVTPKDSWRNWRTLLHYRARGCYSLLEYHRLLEPRLNSWFGRMVAKFVAVLPGHILNALFVLYLGAFRTQPRTRLVDLRSSRYYYRRWLRRPFQRIERGPGRPLSKQQGDT